MPMNTHHAASLSHAQLAVELSALDPCTERCQTVDVVDVFNVAVTAARDRLRASLRARLCAVGVGVGVGGARAPHKRKRDALGLGTGSWSAHLTHGPAVTRTRLARAFDLKRPCLVGRNLRLLQLLQLCQNHFRTWPTAPSISDRPISWYWSGTACTAPLRKRTSGAWLLDITHQSSARRFVDSRVRARGNGSLCNGSRDPRSWRMA